MTDVTRPRRSDGEVTHAAILDAGVRVASVDGLAALTIGRLAQEAGVSKSGLYAHFGSKRRMQLDILRAARDIFDREVVAPAMQVPEGLARLEQVCEAYLSYVERRVFPGGCFFAGMLAEYDARAGEGRDEVASDQRDWLELLGGFARQAQESGELDPRADTEQLVFELTAVVQLANYHFVLFGDPAVLDRARAAVRRVVSGAALDPS